MDYELSSSRRGGGAEKSGSRGGRPGETQRRREATKDNKKKRKVPDSDEDMGSGEEASTLMILIPDQFVGSIIGKSGSKIKRLQWQCKTTIKVSETDDIYPGTSSRTVSLTAPSAASLDAAQQLVLLAVAQAHPDGFREVGVLLSDGQAGKIIGKGGETIKGLREGCLKCDVLDSTEEGGYRVLIVGGDVVELTRTLHEVIEILLRGASGA